MENKIEKKKCPTCGKKQLVKNLDNGNLECLNCNYKNIKDIGVLNEFER